ncbi:hypothetical protein ACFL4L_04195 [bacterium]
MKIYFHYLVICLVLTTPFLGQTQSGVTIDLKNIKGKPLSEVFDKLMEQGFTNIVPVPVPSKLPQETVLGLKIKGQTVEEGVRYSTNLPVRVLVSMGDENIFSDEDSLDESPPNLVTQQITTNPLIMTGTRFQPILIKTQPLLMTGDRFQPIAIQTEPLIMTGTRFQPLSIMTKPLVMTGDRFQSITIQADPLVMTGTRFQPIAIRTDPLTMHGLKPQGDTPVPKKDPVRHVTPPPIQTTVEPVQQDTLSIRSTQQDTTPPTIIPLVKPKTPGPIIPIQPKKGN